jgi:hypothetical protein
MGSCPGCAPALTGKAAGTTGEADEGLGLDRTRREGRRNLGPIVTCRSCPRPRLDPYRSTALKCSIAVPVRFVQSSSTEEDRSTTGVYSCVHAAGARCGSVRAAIADNSIAGHAVAALRALKKRKWSIDARPPFAGPAAVLQYPSRYTHRVAIANSRLLALDETQVTFRWKDYRAATDNRYKTMSLRTPEFIRRFLIHVLPHGFHRIRHYGLFANGQRSANLTTARACLNVQAPSDTHDDEPCDDAPSPLWLTCRACGQGMRIIEIFQPAPRHRGGDPP